MKDDHYRALVVREVQGQFSKSIEIVPAAFLPDNAVKIRVAYAALNYKDALSAKGHKGVSKHYPHTPGVDAAGVVEQSSDARFSPGDEVIVTSYDLGMNTKGAFAEYISVPAEWVVPLPENLSLREAMILGTGGYTAALGIMKIELNGQNPEMGDMVVTGASGGVGSMAVAMFKKLGYRVVASSGKTEYYPWLHEIGAKRCINRDAIIDPSPKPLLSPKWAGAFDTVGGKTLESLLKACGRNGNVATCGLVGSHIVETTVYPFILNGINLLGVDSAETPYDIRIKIWERLASDLKPENLEKMATMVSLGEIPGYMDDILSGETVGRVVADMSLQ